MIFGENPRTRAGARLPEPRGKRTGATDRSSRPCQCPSSCRASGAAPRATRLLPRWGAGPGMPVEGLSCLADRPVGVRDGRPPAALPSLPSTANLGTDPGSRKGKSGPSDQARQDVVRHPDPPRGIGLTARCRRGPSASCSAGARILGRPDLPLQHVLDYRDELFAGHSRRGSPKAATGIRLQLDPQVGPEQRDVDAVRKTLDPELPPQQRLGRSQVLRRDCYVEIQAHDGLHESVDPLPITQYLTPDRQKAITRRETPPVARHGLPVSAPSLSFTRASLTASAGCNRPPRGARRPRSPRPGRPAGPTSPSGRRR